MSEENEAPTQPEVVAAALGKSLSETLDSVLANAVQQAHSMGMSREATAGLLVHVLADQANTFAMMHLCGDDPSVLVSPPVAMVAGAHKIVHNASLALLHEEYPEQVKHMLTVARRTINDAGADGIGKKFREGISQ